MSASLSWWLRLLTRAPSELEAERRARQPSPSPRTPNAQEGPKSAPQRTQAGQGYVTTTDDEDEL
ncbi:hypothetical protein HAP93_03545 [Acidithiobacillus ferriphilus]|uniref:hypothetical protein n=1 Tax=Acidithiobacillus ferriphilus TaxID=1689834 RepID=UPI001C060F0F|nr:hypothetical protein [Acidithiobacillus ferriphilus]MBU2784849.1 hypothetical protein [Acidithiobacillus ferriphilus]